MPRLARAHQILCFVILALSVLQFLWIGLALFGKAEQPGNGLHFMGGYLITLLALVAVLLAAIGRREALSWSAGLFGVLVVQILLVRVSGAVAVLGALHPVNALVVLYFVGAAARGAPMGARARSPEEAEIGPAAGR